MDLLNAIEVAKIELPENIALSIVIKNGLSWIEMDNYGMFINLSGIKEDIPLPEQITQAIKLAQTI